MLIYQSEKGEVHKGWITGFKFLMRPSGRTVLPTPFMKHYMGTVHDALKRRGYDMMKDSDVDAEFWERLLDIAASPPNGVYHQVIASSPIEEEVQGIIDAVESRRQSQNF